MIVFPSRLPSRLAAIAAMVCLPAIAAAQGGGPLRLIPQLPGVDPAPLAQPRFPGPSTTSPTDGVQVETLGTVDPAAFGLMRETDGGMPRSQWRGSNRAQIERLATQIRPSVSPAALTLTRRLLLSEAEPPAGEPGQPGLFAIRVDRLIEIGDPDAAFQLARMAANNPRALAPAIDSALVAGRDEEACRLIGATPVDRQDAAWARASAFCRALSGDSVGAGIQTGLLRERGEVDATFIALMSSIAGLPDKTPIDLKAPTPLDLAMLRAAKRMPAAAVIDGLSPAGARLIADVGGAPRDLALRAMERAYAYGAAPVESLRSRYESFEFKPSELEAASTGKAVQDASGRAALFQAVAAAEGEAAKAKALTVALARLRSSEGGMDARMATAHLEALLSIRPAPEVLDLAPSAARLLIATGQTSRAMEWLRLLEWEGRTGTIDAARSAIRLMPLFRLADRSTLGFPPEDLSDWIDAWRAGPRPENFDSRAVVLLSALQGLGVDVGTGIWNKLAVANASPLGHRPNAAAIQALRSAAHAGRVGETVLLALIALDGRSPAALEADALANVLDALVRVDLETDARALAIEAAIGLGL